MAKKVKRRLDEELVEQGLFDDVADAMRAVLAGEVSSRGTRLTAPGSRVEAGVDLHVKGSSRQSRLGRGRYVGRGGLKLEAALERFSVDVHGMNCLDVGCSTGGFTDCLLKAGAQRVAAVDVGYGQFDWGLRTDDRVALFERTNICDASPEGLGAPFDLAVSDVSFTSIATVLPAIVACLGEDGLFCTLVKPQFEAARRDVGEGGVVRDPAVHEAVLARAVDALNANGLCVLGLCGSPIRGAKGNIEYFALAGCGDYAPCDCSIPAVVAQAWAV